MTEASPLNMHTDAGGAMSPLNMHTDAATVTPFNMHTDMVVAGGANGSINLSANNSAGARMAVTITAGMAGKLGAVLGLSGPPAVSPHAPAPVAPCNMHTDAKTTVTANPARSKAILEGPADGPSGAMHLKITIDGPALATVKGSHAGI